ncbi:MAG: hypothetical protein ACMXX6_01165 [Candidatus Woesearchaeota archaeon]
MKLKKGQAAVEFLTTYGWALAVIIVMIAVISLFGVTNPDRFVNERCIAPAGFVCEDFAVFSSDVSNSQLSLRFRNRLGYDINVLSPQIIDFGTPLWYSDSGIYMGAHHDEILGNANFFQSGVGSGYFTFNARSNYAAANSPLYPGELKKFYVDVYYYRASSGIEFNRKVTFELIARVR